MESPYEAPRSVFKPICTTRWPSMFFAPPFVVAAETIYISMFRPSTHSSFRPLGCVALAFDQLPKRKLCWQALLFQTCTETRRQSPPGEEPQLVVVSFPRVPLHTSVQQDLDYDGIQHRHVELHSLRRW